MEEVELAGGKIGLPQIESEKFWHFYESKGWKVGKNPMKSWLSALAGWKLRWQERKQETGGDQKAEQASLLMKEALRVARDSKRL